MSRDCCPQWTNQVNNKFGKMILSNQYISVWVCQCVLAMPFNFQYFLIFFLTGVQLLYNVVLVSVVQQSQSAICIHICPLFWISYLESRKMVCCCCCCRFSRVQLCAIPQTAAHLLQSRNRDTDIEHKCMNTKWGNGSWNELGDWD